MNSALRSLCISRSRPLITPGILVLTFVISVSSQTATSQESHPKLDPAVRYALEQATDTSTVAVIITATAGRFAGMRADVLATGNSIAAEHRFIDSLSARLRASDIRALETDGAVAHVSLDHVVRSTAAAPTTPSAPTAGGPVDAVLLSTLGLTSASITGKGVGVAVIDSGLQPSTELPAFAFLDFTNKPVATAAYDDYGHGTHISGLIRASGTTTNPRASNSMVGVAPGVRLISMKVLDSTGQGYTSRVLTALESVLTNRGSLGIDVVNLSLGHPITEPGATDPLVQAVEALSRKGIVIVAAAGNFGRNPVTGVTAYAGITSPGNAASAVTVGALDSNDTVIRSDDGVATYSSRGPTWYDGRIKPDVVAPGHNLVSLAALGSSLYTSFPEQRVADAAGAARFLRLSGTSMATAVTTGVVALMIEQHRKVSSLPLTPNDVKAVLQFTAIPVSGTDILTQGAGALNPPGALSLVAVLNGKATTDLRSTTVLQPMTTIGSETCIWNQGVIWGHSVVTGNTVYANEPAWGSLTTWGSAVIWGHGLVGQGDLLWDSASTWSMNTVWDPLIAPSSAGVAWPDLGGQGVIWGHGGPY